VKAFDRILGRSQAWKACLTDKSGNLTRSAEIALADLRRFCRGSTSTVTVSPISRTIDPLAMAMAEGRREVWLRIVNYLELDERTISALREESERRAEDAA